MSVELGLGWIVSIDTTGTPTWGELPNQRAGKLTLDRDSTEINTKQNAGWRDFLTHIRGWSIPVDGFADPTDVVMAFILESVAFATEVDITVPVQIANEGGDVYTGDAVLESVEIDMPMDAPVTYSFTLKGRGALDYTPRTP